MTRTQRMALGVATVWPFLWIAIFFGSVLSIVFASVTEAHPQREQVTPWAVGLLVAGHIFTILWILALIAIYLVILFRTNYVPEPQKPLWAVALVMTSALGCAVFWFAYIRPQRDDVMP